ncbi:hypothetical protein L209DRAFT_749263 [Thermothelomyces heterothallicus CBS 203.75]
MKLHGFLDALGAPVQDAEEETFELFAQDLPSQNLGFIDSRATTLELTVAGRDFSIHQSPGILSSNRAGGTTGAVVWKITPLFAEWLASPANPFFAHGVLSPSSLAVELGCGIAGLVALLLAPRISRYVLTDQPYVAKLVEQNVSDNWPAACSASASTSASASVSGKAARLAASTPAGRGRAKETTTAGSSGPARGERRIHFAPLDWETDRVTAALTGSGEARSFDVVLACDCIYNEALVDPFVSTCVDLCRLRAAEEEEEEQEGQGLGPNPGREPCVCVVAQQLRDPLVFEAWMTRFARSFHTWRVPDRLLSEGLRSNSGFVVHVGVLKDDISL